MTSPLRVDRDTWRRVAEKLQEENETLEADNAALRQDAERYRWLKLHGLHLWQMQSGMNDAAIDAALLAGKERPCQNG